MFLWSAGSTWPSLLVCCSQPSSLSVFLHVCLSLLCTHTHTHRCPYEAQNPRSHHYWCSVCYLHFVDPGHQGVVFFRYYSYVYVYISMCMFTIISRIPPMVLFSPAVYCIWYVYIQILVHIYVRIYIFTYIYIYIYIYVYVYMHTCININVCVYVNMYTYMYIYKYMYDIFKNVLTRT